MRCRACATSVDEPDGVPLCPACAAVTGSPREPARSASTPALWLWTSPHAAAALATGDLSVMIRTWRQATGTSQLALAEKLGYDPSYISMIETRRRDVVDIVNRRRIAQHLGIPLHRVGVTDTEAVDHVTMLQFGYSTLRLATIARHAGHGAAAVNELWPLVARLEARADDGIIDKDMLLLLARARAELGVSLGYVLPEERLTFAVRWTGRALRVAEHLDDTDLHAYTLRVHGNELRKAGRVNAALVRLARAVAIAGADQRAPALVQLARAAQDPATFDATLTELHRTRDLPACDDPLVSATAVREVNLRGLITTGRAPQAIALLSASPAPTLPTSPQWRIIEQITIAEVLLAAGDVTTGESTLHDAIGGGERHRLPHQLQRAARVAQGHCPTVVEAASAALSRSTTPAAGYPTQG
ncbi:helix-turn-helix transcriptional regulator [Salinispora arenicola]|nr:helix-turn-helix domain-containing protein [Salinispora arenicola]NIL55673.1 helix-turn-helix transcriptional regulator [Salinispora arenicola]NIL64046.1 helix-turn-helix transcriptional regulator [Salinispora arenicola]